MLGLVPGMRKADALMSRNFIHTSKFARSSVGKRVIDGNGCLGTITAASQERRKAIKYSIRFDDGRHTIVDERTCRGYLLNYEKSKKGEGND
jgi:hypothetical protein